MPAGRLRRRRDVGERPGGWERRDGWDMLAGMASLPAQVDDKRTMVVLLQWSLEISRKKMSVRGGSWGVPGVMTHPKIVLKV